MFFKGVSNLTETLAELEDWQSKPTFIICNSNAMFYQQMVHQSHSDYLRFFIDKGINVFIWNYRSYGRSKGTISPDNLRNDIHEVYKFLITKIGVTGKVGVYGRSLGGIPTCHISPLVDMIIVDRSFSNLRDMAVARFGGRLADFLFKVGSLGW